MPNHEHGIIELTHVVVENFQPPPAQQNAFQKIIPYSIGSIIRGFKIGVTKWSRGTPPSGVENFQPPRSQPSIWQRNYYEHIIRNEQSYNNISNYIINNPAKWKGDKFYCKVENFQPLR